MSNESAFQTDGRTGSGTRGGRHVAIGQLGIRGGEEFLSPRRGTVREMSQWETGRPSCEEGFVTRRRFERLVTKSICTSFFPQGPDEACRQENFRQHPPNSAVPVIAQSGMQEWKRVNYRVPQWRDGRVDATAATRDRYKLNPGLYIT